MANDFLQSWLQHLNVPWWGIGLVYPAFALSLDTILCLIFGGKARLRELKSDPVHLYWVALMLGIIPLVYAANRRATGVTIALLTQNGIDVLLWRYHLLVRTDGWLQWSVLFLSLALVLFSVRRYALVRREKTWFAKLPWPAYLLRTMLLDLPVAYMVCMTVISLVDWMSALNRIFVHIPSTIVVDTWHLDGLYGLKPAYKLLVGQFGVGLLASFLPALMLLREGEQPYSSMYKAGVLIGIAAVAAIAFLVLYNFSSAIGRVKLSAMTTIVDSLRVPQPQPTRLLREMYHIILLLEYQIAALLPSSLPIPGWLAVLGTSRILLLVVEFYSLLQPTLGTPKVPDILRRLIEI